MSFLEQTWRPKWLRQRMTCWSWLCSCSGTSDSLSAPWTVARQAPVSVGFSRLEFWSGLPFPPPGGLPDPGIRTCIPCIGRRILHHWAPGKAKRWVPLPAARLRAWLIGGLESWVFNLFFPGHRNLPTSIPHPATCTASVYLDDFPKQEQLICSNSPPASHLPQSITAGSARNLERWFQDERAGRSDRSCLPEFSVVSLRDLHSLLFHLILLLSRLISFF